MGRKTDLKEIHKIAIFHSLGLKKHKETEESLLFNFKRVFLSF